MIARLSGKLIAVKSGEALVEVNGLTYGILISAFAEEALTLSGTIDREVTFHIFHYIEGGVAMGHMVPRLVGFLGEEDRDFFMLLITVPGLGVKKALRSLVISTAQVARAIELNDIQTLKMLPEIGAKTAQKIVMELRGKVALFAGAGEYEVAPEQPAAMFKEEYQHEAFEILRQLQYVESEAVEIIRRTCGMCPEITTADALIQEIFKRTKR